MRYVDCLNCQKKFITCFEGDSKEVQIKNSICPECHEQGYTATLKVVVEKNGSSQSSVDKS